MGIREGVGATSLWLVLGCDEVGDAYGKISCCDSCV